jgi:hypothetical protein
LLYSNRGSRSSGPVGSTSTECGRCCSPREDRDGSCVTSNAGPHGDA